MTSLYHIKVTQLGIYEWGENRERDVLHLDIYGDLEATQEGGLFHKSQSFT